MRIAGAVSAAAALVLATGLVWHSSYAGFSDATTPLAAQVATGTLALTDDDSAVRMFSTSGLKPGDTETKCIAVSSSGSPATVRMYGTGRSSTNGLSGQLSLTISLGTGGSSSGCTGFTSSSTVYNGTLAALPADSWSAGVGGWTTTGTAVTTKVYRITYTLSASSPASTQDGSATVSFVWEARTT